MREDLKSSTKVHASGKEALIYTRKPVLNIYMKGVAMHSELVIKLIRMVKSSRHDN